MRVDIFGTVITFPGRSGVSQALAGVVLLQLCAVLGRSGIKSSEYIYTMKFTVLVIYTNFNRSL
jgi:hypothetical protein